MCELVDKHLRILAHQHLETKVFKNKQRGNENIIMTTIEEKEGGEVGKKRV